MSVLNQIKGIKKCKTCVKLFGEEDASNAITYTGFCNNHLQYKSLSCYSKYPLPRKNSSDLYGLEIELKGDAYVVNNLAKFVCADGSVRGGGEIKLLGNFESAKRQVRDVLNRAKIGDCYTDRDCGFHIHFSREDITADSYTVLNLIARIQSDMFNVFSERSNNQYCKRINGVEDILWSHYSWFNYSSKVPTMEVRIFPGTVNPETAVQYLSITRYLKKYLKQEISLSVMRRKIGLMKKCLGR